MVSEVGNLVSLRTALGGVVSAVCGLVSLGTALGGRCNHLQKGNQGSEKPSDRHRSHSVSDLEYKRMSDVSLLLPSPECTGPALGFELSSFV